MGLHEDLTREFLEWSEHVKRGGEDSMPWLGAPGSTEGIEMGTDTHTIENIFIDDVSTGGTVFTTDATSTLGPFGKISITEASPSSQPTSGQWSGLLAEPVPEVDQAVLKGWIERHLESCEEMTVGNSSRMAREEFPKALRMVLALLGGGEGGKAFQEAVVLCQKELSGDG